MRFEKATKSEKQMLVKILTRSLAYNDHSIIEVNDRHIIVRNGQKPNTLHCIPTLSEFAAGLGLSIYVSYDETGIFACIF